MTITQDRTTEPLLTKDGPRHRDPIKPVPFSRVVHVETRKQVDTTASRWFLIGIAGVTLLVFAIMLFTDSGASTWMNYLGGATTPLSVLLPIVGIMAATSEWSQRTAMTTFTLEPRRGRTILAKVISSLIIGAVLFAVAAVFSAIVYQIAISARGVESDWTVLSWAVGGAAIILLFGLLQGSAFGLALLNTPAAVVAYFALPTAVSGVSLLLPSWETFFSWTDINTTMIPFFMGVAPTSDEWTKFVVSGAIWVALPMAVGVWRVLHREVK